MVDRQTRYEMIEANLRYAKEDARQTGDKFLAFLLEIALLETRLKASQELEKSGETRTRRDC